ncbi:hypothetical protein ACFO1B_38980 [Dactylosporangium siamense]|uniref:Uncharacterized protein n=1 Tax=Dactylosporangium siamense TaxID=685454 RepID=A0A919UFM5_9ACTN|nr:hypothetical protein [Dactylosporangium siamense]GIG50336.1 hypothetical protein Dsi01nite_083770 [Dactylosporangium siamense]
MATRKTSITEVPYDKRGNLLFYVEGSRGYSYLDDDAYVVPYSMRPNVAFTATLTLDSMRTGRSAKYLVWRDTGGHHYPMFISDLTTMLPLVTVSRGVVSGTWIVRKKGQNFGIALDTGS